MESYTTENVNQGARTNKFDVRCRTNLTDYLGEHQAQVFYAHLLIDQIVTPTGSEPPIRIRIGQSIPVDLTNRRIESGEISAPEPCPVLAMPVYFFKRESNSRSGHVSAVEERNDVSYTISADMPSSGDSSPKRVSNNREKSDRNLISLVTLIIYFPVSVMNSANSLCVVGDQQKHVHLAPHPHEFVAYPSTITLPVEELGGRIVRGFQHAQTLTTSAMELPETLLMHKLQRSDESQQSTELGRCSGTQLTHLVDTESHKLEKHFDTKHPTFVVISRDVYNRLQTLRRIQMDGVSLDQLQRPRNTVSRPWYSKVICTTPLSSTSPPVSNESDNRNPSGPISFLNWSGLRVATNLETTNGSSLSARQYSAGGYYVVFVRRQSFDCGAAIDSELISTQYPSAKFRRTRVRGTLHCGIKLKRRLTNTNGLDGIQNMMTINSRLIPPNLVKQMSGEDGLSWCIVSPIQRQEPTGWYTAFHSHSVDESRCSATELHSSIAARVKRTPNSMGQDGTETGNSIDCTIRTSSSKLDEIVVDNLVDDVLMRPRNRVPPRRFDLTDPDLEIALKRSLIEQTPIRKRRSESDVCESPNHISNRPDHVPVKQSKKLGNVERSKQSAGTPYQSTFRNQSDQSTSRTSEHGYSMVEQNMLNSQMADSDEKSVLSTKARIEDSKCEIISELSKSDKICLPPNRQGNDQLSCVVVNRSKFIPKLKLAKRSNGKFKILHLSRKRNCPLRSNCKLQKTPTRSVMNLITSRKTGSTVKNTGVHSVSVVSSNRSDCESLTGSNTFKALGPLNLSTHRRFLESNECLTMKSASTDLPPKLLPAHDLNDRSAVSGLRDPPGEVPFQGMDQLLSDDIVEHAIPLTMWTKLKNPLPAPELYAEALPEMNIPTFQTTVVSTSNLPPPVLTISTSLFGQPPPLPYAERRFISQSQTDRSVMRSRPTNDTALVFGQLQSDDSMPNAVAKHPTQNVTNSVSDRYAVLTEVKPSIESTVLCGTPGGIFSPTPLNPFVQTISTPMPGLSVPVKPPVPYTIPQVTTPVMCPNVIPNWPLIRGPCEPNLENYMSLSNSWNTIPVPVHGAPGVGKSDGINTVFFVQPHVPPQSVYGCNITGSGWIQTHDVNSPWPTVQPLPSVQFIT